MMVLPSPSSTQLHNTTFTLLTRTPKKSNRKNIYSVEEGPLIEDQMSASIADAPNPKQTNKQTKIDHIQLIHTYFQHYLKY